MKLYADEDGASTVRAIPDVIVSALARVEVAAALWAKQRSGALPPVVLRVLLAEFEADYYGDGRLPPRFAVVLIDDALLGAAARLAGMHRLRAYDSVQLATAVAARAAEPECRMFACFDDALADAAVAEGFTVVR